MLPGLSLAPLTLAAVLVVSGLAKLRDVGSTASMLTALRLPRLLRHPAVARSLPVVEMLVAALLLTPWRATYAAGAVLALLLFTAFLWVVARAMTFDPRPVCGCFGRVGDHRVNGRTVGRNVLLLALAVLTVVLAVAGRPAAAIVAGYGPGEWVWLLLAGALAAVAVLVLGGVGSATADRPGATADRPGTAVDEPHRGPHVPRGVVLSQDLQAVPLRRLARLQPQLLVLVNCWCGPTFESIERLPRWRARLPGVGVQLVHTHRPWDEESLAAEQGVWWDPGATVYDALTAGPSPAAVVLDADGLLAGRSANGVESIDELVDLLAGRPAPVPGADDQPVRREDARRAARDAR